MKYIFPFIIFLFFIPLADAQFYVDQIEVDSFQCIADPAVKIYKYKKWDVYQTTDDTWDGPIDESLCINLKKIITSNGQAYRYYIDLNTIDQSRSLYVRYDMSTLSSPYSLDQNSLNVVEASMFTDETIDLNFGTDCNEKLCSGLIIHTEASDPMYTEVLEKIALFPFTQINNCNVNSCLAAEKTMTNQINEVIYKITMPPNANHDAALSFSSVSLYDPGLSLPVKDEVIIPNATYNGTSYEVEFENIFSPWGPTLLLHSEDGLPSANNPSIIPMLPQTNPSERRQINFYINEYSGLYYQSFTQLLGGFVEGSTTERHDLTIINNSLDMCIGIVEIVNEDGTDFEFRGGNIGFGNANGCLQFRNDSKMIISDGVHLNYGEGGVGNLNLRPGGTIDFKKNASLFFDGTLILTPYDEYEGKQEVYVHLPKGSKLIFSEYAKIKNEFGGLLLHIYMEGGVIDMSDLDPISKSKIKLIYPKHETNNDFAIISNPIQDHSVVYNPNNLQIDEISIFNMNGHCLTIAHHDTKEEFVDLNCSGLNPNIYLVKIKSETKEETHKVLVID